MKIIDRSIKLTDDQIVESQASKLYESFKRCPSEVEFLRENGNNIDNSNLFSKLALVESVTDKSKSFMFENGMRIPKIGVKIKSKKSLNGIFEDSENVNEFVELVESQITKPFLDFNLTELDKLELVNEYNLNKSK